jgi:hypothetical protein
MKKEGWKPNSLLGVSLFELRNDAQNRNSRLIVGGLDDAHHTCLVWAEALILNRIKQSEHTKADLNEIPGTLTELIWRRQTCLAQHRVRVQPPWMWDLGDRRSRKTANRSVDVGRSEEVHGNVEQVMCDFVAVLDRSNVEAGQCAPLLHRLDAADQPHIDPLPALTELLVLRTLFILGVDPENAVDLPSVIVHRVHDLCRLGIDAADDADNRNLRAEMSTA